MGAFYLFRTREDPDATGAKGVFERKGFGQPQVRSLGPWTLLQYAKQLVDEENYLEGDDGWAVFSVGSPVYRGTDYRRTLALVLRDFRQGKLNLNAFRGNFTLLLWDGATLSLLTDRLGVGRVFYDEGRATYSSSFLALVASAHRTRKLNRLAVLEKLASGYVVGPDTLVEGIQQLTPTTIADATSESLRVLEWPASDLELADTTTPWERSVDEHLDRLQTYFDDISPISRAYGVDLGLSSGYDSRLVALLAQSTGADLSVHTHLIKGVHEPEKERASRLADVIGVRLRVNPMPQLERASGDLIDESLLDGLYYYDGRSADNSGAYSTTYTRSYKALTLGDHRLRLNGEGGEIYRNYYCTAPGRLNFREWMRHRLFYLPAEHSLRKTNQVGDTVDYVLNKIGARLNMDVRGVCDSSVARAYYGEVRIPDCEGTLANADGQLAHFLVPFAEADVQRSAYSLTRHVGYSGLFQAALIERLSPAAAGVDSHHGFPLSEESLAHRMRCWTKAQMPPSFWLRRNARRLADPAFGQASVERYTEVWKKSVVAREAEEALRAYVPGFDPEESVRNHPAKATMVYVGVLLREFSEYLSA